MLIVRFANVPLMRMFPLGPSQIVTNSSRLLIQFTWSEGVVWDGRSQPRKLKWSTAGSSKSKFNWLQIFVSATTPINIRWSRNCISGSRRRSQQVDSAGYGLYQWRGLFFLFNGSSEKKIIEHFLFWRNNVTLMRAHLGTFKASTLCPVADDLTPAAGAELAARVIPYVAMVTHRALVQAAPLGSHALLAALTSTLDFSLTLQGSARPRLNCVFIHKSDF